MPNKKLSSQVLAKAAEEGLHPQYQIATIMCQGHELYVDRACFMDGNAVIRIFDPLAGPYMVLGRNLSESQPRPHCIWVEYGTTGDPLQLYADMVKRLQSYDILGPDTGRLAQSGFNVYQEYPILSAHPYPLKKIRDDVDRTESESPL